MVEYRKNKNQAHLKRVEREMAEKSAASYSLLVLLKTVAKEDKGCPLLIRSFSSTKEKRIGKSMTNILYYIEGSQCE